MKTKNKMKKGVAALVTFVGMTSVASAQDAAGLAGSFTTAIGGNDTLMWTIGGAVAAFVATVVVIGLIIRGSKSVAKSS